MARIGFTASEEMSFENVDDGRTMTTDGRRMPAYTISSPIGELKNVEVAPFYSHIWSFTQFIWRYSLGFLVQTLCELLPMLQLAPVTTSPALPYRSMLQMLKHCFDNNKTLTLHILFLSFFLSLDAV